ncbi:MAG: hypothetical protein AAF744_02215 [Pseudomonadota bacterium]
MSPQTVWNPGLLRFPTAPRKILQRGLVLPRGQAGIGVFCRALFESLWLRCVLALAPFLATGFTWPSTALPLSQAPIAMLALIGFVELRLFRVPRRKRDQVTTEAEAARALDTLQFRGRRILAQLAAKRGIESGTIYLVVEQSDLVRVPPLTLASLQLDHGKSRLAPLSESERAIIREGLFDDEFTERDLLKANLREDVMMRAVSFEARGVSAHARLAAFLDTTPPATETPA